MAAREAKPRGMRLARCELQRTAKRLLTERGITLTQAELTVFHPRACSPLVEPRRLYKRVLREADLTAS